MQMDPASTGGRGALLRVAGLSKRYVRGGFLSPRRVAVQALRDAELTLHAGSTLALVGASGSGKSTLARCIACMERPDTGEIWFSGQNLAAMTDGERIPFRRQIQLIFQDPAGSLNPRFSAVEIVAEPLLIAGAGKQYRREYAIELMNQVGLSADWGKRMPHQLSGGQRRRLAIARALAAEPRILLLDEALTGLDLRIRGQLADLLLELQATRSLSYLCIAHDLSLVAQLADEVILLHNGQITRLAEMAEWLKHPHEPEAAALLGETVGVSSARGGR
jgi:ABC-type glutathione transport system ATPase component